MGEIDQSRRIPGLQPEIPWVRKSGNALQHIRPGCAEHRYHVHEVSTHDSRAARHGPHSWRIHDDVPCRWPEAMEGIISAASTKRHAAFRGDEVLFHTG